MIRKPEMELQHVDEIKGKFVRIFRFANLTQI
jgi:hypothetical protein